MTCRIAVSKVGAIALTFLVGCALSPVCALAEGDAGVSLDRQVLDLCPGDTFALTAAVTAAGASLIWATGDGNVAVVKDGVVTAKAVGTADITAATADGKLSAVCKVIVKPGEMKSSAYKIDKANGLLTGVPKMTSSAVLLAGFENAPADLGILDRGGKAFAGAAVGTGMTVQLSVNGKLRDSLKVVVTGDVNGDGAISIADYTLTRLDILGLKKLAGEDVRAGDANGDGAVSISDYTMMRLDILGLKSIATPDVELPEINNSKIKALLDFALTLQGKPYVWGAEGPDSFDCSGFIYYCLNQTGYKVGRATADTYSKYEAWQYVAKDSLQPGDLLFFISDNNPDVIGHVGIYLGNRTLISASSSSSSVVVSRLTGWYAEKLSHGRRVFY